MQLTPEKSVSGANPKFDTTTEYHEKIWDMDIVNLQHGKKSKKHQRAGATAIFRRISNMTGRVKFGDDVFGTNPWLL